MRIVFLDIMPSSYIRIDYVIILYYGRKPTYAIEMAISVGIMSRVHFGWIICECGTAMAEDRYVLDINSCFNPHKISPKLRNLIFCGFTVRWCGDELCTAGEFCEW